MPPINMLMNNYEPGWMKFLFRNRADIFLLDFIATTDFDTKLLAENKWTIKWAATKIIKQNILA